MTDTAGLARELAREAEAHREQLVERVLRLAAVDAPSGAGAEAMRPAGDLLTSELAALPGRLTRTVGPQGDLLEVSLGPRTGPLVMLLGHYDLTWPAGTAAQRPVRLEDDVIHGPGVFDMLGGIAATIGALKLLGKRRLCGPVHVLFTPDEETGGETSRARIIELGTSAALVLVMEPSLPGGRLKTARSGWAAYRLVAHGRSAHAGLEPNRGVSAVDELCDALVAIRELARPSLGTTVNAGVIAGGTFPNMVAAEAYALLDVRARTSSEQSRVEQALTALSPARAEAGLEVTRLHARPPMERTPAIATAMAHARKLAALLDIELGEGSAGGTSDANLVAERGVAVLDGLGPDGGGAHAREERIRVDSLVERAALIALLVARPLPAAVA